MTATLQHKSIPFGVQAVEAKAKTITGLGAAYSLDLGGDVIERGAFRRCIADLHAGRLIMKGVDSHRYDSIMYVFGKVIRAREVDAGLEVQFQYIPDDPTAEAAYRRAVGGYVNGLSIGYTAKTREPTRDERARGVRRVLTEVYVVEVSMVQAPMNPDAVIPAGTSKTAGGMWAADVVDLSDLVQRVTLGAARLREADDTSLKVTLSKLRTDRTRPLSHTTRDSIRQTLQALRRQQLDAVRDGARRLHSTRIP